MKRVLALMGILLLLGGCARSSVKSANEVAHTVRENQELLLECVAAMEALGEERIYVAMEEETKKNDEGNEEKTGRVRLVSFQTSGDDRVELDSPVLQEILETFGFELIFFQTGSDSRRVVIFAYTKEKAEGIQNGFYYSYDALPCGWWGRAADLKRKDDRYLQISPQGNAWYYTVLIEDHFYYYEKEGDLLA